MQSDTLWGIFRASGDLHGRDVLGHDLIGEAVMARNRKQVALRCFAKYSGGVWVAFCVDLNLAAQAETLVDARRKLHSQIDDYIEELHGVHKQHAADLFPRRAPLRIMAWYFVARIVTGVSFIFRGYSASRAAAFREAVYC